jgi:methyl-accepting chemotaxis protein
MLTGPRQKRKVRNKVLPVIGVAAVANVVTGFVVAWGIADIGPAKHLAAGNAVALAALATARNASTLAVVCCVATSLSFGFAAWTVRSLTRRLRRLREALVAIGGGDLTRRADAGGRDEIGMAAAAANQVVDRMRAVAEVLVRTSTVLGAAADKHATTTCDVDSNAARTSTQAAAVAVAARQVSHNVETVAAGSSEMSVAISEIAYSALDATQVAAEAAESAASANQLMTALSRSSAEVTGVVEVITAVASQTKLLALNATIEAVRAGAAGKGFAVVADEVKGLALETGAAAEDISRRVAAIQADAANALAAIRKIGKVISIVKDYQLTIASAVDQQTSTTLEIKHNVREASERSSEIAASIDAVAAAARATAEASLRSQGDYDEWAQLSAEIGEVAGCFRW